MSSKKIGIPEGCQLSKVDRDNEEDSGLPLAFIGEACRSLRF